MEHSVHSQEWFDEAFSKANNKVPPVLRSFCEAFCKKYRLTGTADPLYVANVVASQMGFGDGAGTFLVSTKFPVDEEGQNARAIAAQMHKVYGCPKEEVARLVRAVFRFKPAGCHREAKRRDLIGGVWAL